MITPVESSAWVRDPAKKELVRLRLGDDLAGLVREGDPLRPPPVGATGGDGYVNIARLQEHASAAHRGEAGGAQTPATAPPAGRQRAPRVPKQNSGRQGSEPAGPRQQDGNRPNAPQRPGVRNPRTRANARPHSNSNAHNSNAKCRSNGLRLPLICFLAALLAMLSACERSQWDPTVKIGDPKGHIVDKGDPRRGRRARTYAAERSRHQSGSRRRTDREGFRQVRHRNLRAQGLTAVGGYHPRRRHPELRRHRHQRGGQGHPRRSAAGELRAGPERFGRGLPANRPSAAREHLIPTLETLLRMNNAALVNRGGTYEVVPLTNAVQGKVVPQLGESSRRCPRATASRWCPCSTSAPTR